MTPWSGKFFLFFSCGNSLTSSCSGEVFLSLCEASLFSWSCFYHGNVSSNWTPHSWNHIDFMHHWPFPFVVDITLQIIAWNVSNLWDLRSPKTGSTRNFPFPSSVPLSFYHLQSSLNLPWVLCYILLQTSNSSISLSDFPFPIIHTLSYLPTSYLSRNWGTSQSKFLRMNETKGKKKQKKHYIETHWILYLFIWALETSRAICCSLSLLPKTKPTVSKRLLVRAKKILKKSPS